MCKFYEGRDYSLLDLYYLKLYLVRNKILINVVWMNECIKVCMYLLREKEKEKNVKIYIKLLDMVIFREIIIVGEEEVFDFYFINLYINEI